MMDTGPPDQKRPRLTGPTPGPPTWQNSAEASRQLPPPPPANYPHHNSPFSRPEPQSNPLDRRHSEHHYDHQDPRRPNSGPSHIYHPPPPPYTGPREPMVKRDPSDEPPQPSYRPSSTGNGTEHNVNQSQTHHEGPARPYLPPPGPHTYQTNPYPPNHSPMSATEPYSHSVFGSSGLPPPREQYPPASYPSARVTEQVRKKAQRASQACDMCRALKAKCDEGRPACSSCKERQQDCHYRDPPPKQQDKASADIMEGIAQLQSAMAGTGSKLDSLAGRIERVESYLQRVFPNSEAGLKEEPQEYPPMPFARHSVGSESQALPSNDSPFSSTPGQQRIVERMEIRHREEDEEEEEDGGDPGPQGAPSIPVNHTTGAARLLLVGPIAEMCKGIIKTAKIKNEKYPMLQEKKRGSIRLYGRGEGTDTPPGYDKDPLNDQETISTPGDTHSDASSPAAYDSGEPWGQLGGLTPPSNQTSDLLARGPIGAEGMPDFSKPVVLELVKVYKEKINNMHPILIPRNLDALVDSFLKSIPENQPKPKQVSTLVAVHAPPYAPSAGFVAGFRNPESPGNKRKRSPGMGDQPETQSTWDHKPGHPYRSMSTCLVLLVMALGKVCQHKGRIPDVARDSESSSVNSPTIRNGHPPSPLQSSPSLSSAPGLPSPYEGERNHNRSRRTSIEGAYAGVGRAKTRNIDLIPGLAYFALATDILGNQMGGNSLQHVHAHLLAGLYYGQLVRVLDSAAHIHIACRTLQVILRVKLDRFKKLKNEPAIPPAKDNPLIFAFWTCLQLESDIVAELPYPQSGILTYEEDMPAPNLQAASDVDGFEPIIIESYSAQLFLRKHLNQLHNMFYRPSSDPQFIPVFSGKETQKHFPTIEASQANLNNIDYYAPHMKWNANDSPATDIIAARLRAKYYGAQVITYRHFILKVLEHSAAKSSEPGEQISGEFLSEVQAPALNKDATKTEDLDPKVLEYAKNCIKALISSTTAFYGLKPWKERLIVTNVWGTAHAQWGNVLTLQAAYKDPILNPLIDREELVYLTERTLEFLLLVAQPSSALYIDWKILKQTAHVTGLIPDGPNTSSSFSSTTT